MRPHLLLVGISSLASTMQDCSGDPPIAGGDAGNTSFVSVASLPLVGPETCQTDGAGYLVRCVIPDKTLTGTPFDSAVPVRTVFKRSLTGTCVANKNPRLSLQVTGELPVSWSFMATPQVILRRGERTPITAVSLHDELPAETFGIRMTGCRVTLDAVFNEPDVNSKAEAEALLASLEEDRDRKVALRDRLSQLHQLSSAVVFLKRVGEYFMTDLTSAQMNELRTAALSADDALVNLLLNCASGVSQDDRANLTQLHAQLWVLGEPSKWVNTDGTPKSLADFFGPDAQSILTSIQKATQNTSDAGSNLQAELQAASLDAERAIARVGQARQQLAAWLT